MQAAQRQHRDQRSPDLGLDRVRRGADAGLDLQVLFERFEEQLDLPAILVDGSNGGCAEAVVIGEKHQGISRVCAVASTRRSSWRSSLLLAESFETSRSPTDMYVNFPFTPSDGEIYEQW